MVDDVGALLENLGWLESMEMKCVSYDRLVVEF